MSEAKVTALGANKWRIQIERNAAGISCIGEAVVISEKMPDPVAAPHAGLASARAALALGRELVAQNDFKPALDCFHDGIAALGRRYATHGMRDDSSIKIAAADERAGEGALQDAAEILNGVLEARLNQYALRHKAELAG